MLTQLAHTQKVQSTAYSKMLGPTCVYMYTMYLLFERHETVIHVLYSGFTSQTTIPGWLPYMCALHNGASRFYTHNISAPSEAWNCGTCNTTSPLLYFNTTNPGLVCVYVCILHYGEWRNARPHMHTMCLLHSETSNSSMWWMSMWISHLAASLYNVIL